MLITSKQIKKRLFRLFPELTVPWLRDEAYELPSLEQVKEFLKRSKVNEYHFVDEVFDCDDFALQLHAEVKREFHWAFGEAFGDRFNGEEKLHNSNIFMADNYEIYLVEPQTDKIWLAVRGQDNILIVGM